MVVITIMIKKLRILAFALIFGAHFTYADTASGKSNNENVNEKTTSKDPQGKDNNAKDQSSVVQVAPASTTTTTTTPASTTTTGADASTMAATTTATTAPAIEKEIRKNLEGELVGLGKDIIDFSEGDYITEEGENIVEDIEEDDDDNEEDTDQKQKHKHTIKTMPVSFEMTKNLDQLIFNIIYSVIKSTCFLPDEHVKTIAQAIKDHIAPHEKMRQLTAAMSKSDALLIDNALSMLCPEVKAKYTLPVNGQAGESLTIESAFSLSSQLLKLNSSKSSECMTEAIADFATFINEITMKTLDAVSSIFTIVLLKEQLHIRHQEAKDCIALGDAVPAKINHQIAISISKLNREIDKQHVSLAGFAAECNGISRVLHEIFDDITYHNVLSLIKNVVHTYLFEGQNIEFAKATSGYNRFMLEAKEKQLSAFDAQASIAYKHDLLIPANTKGLTFNLGLSLSNPFAWVTAKRMIDYASTKYASDISKIKADYATSHARLNGKIRSLYSEISTATTLFMFAEQIALELTKNNNYVRIRDIAKTTIDSRQSIDTMLKLSFDICKEVADINTKTVCARGFSQFISAN
jgi:hypothetical protein